MTALRLGLCQYGVTAPANFDAYAEKLAALVAEGKEGGADLLVMPEYAAMETAAFCAGTGDAHAELLGVCALTQSLLTLFQGL